jgi:uncharacterized membrane protein
MVDLHPAVVHVPLGLAVVLPIVLLVLVNHTRWGWPRSAFGIAVALQAVLFLGALLALRTGEGAEERVEHRVPDAAIETHEHWATAFTWTAGGVLALLLAGWWLPANRKRFAVRAAAVAGSFAVLGLGVVAGYKGGELVYTHGAAGVAAPPTGGEHDRNDK